MLCTVPPIVGRGRGIATSHWLATIYEPNVDEDDPLFHSLSGAAATPLRGSNPRVRLESILLRSWSTQLRVPMSQWEPRGEITAKVVCIFERSSRSVKWLASLGDATHGGFFRFCALAIFLLEIPIDILFIRSRLGNRFSSLQVIQYIV